MSNIYFSGKMLGKSLKEVSVDLIQIPSVDNVEEVVSRWYHSDHDVDLFIWVDSKASVIKQQMMISGQVVEWNCLEGIKTGMMVENGAEGADGDVVSEMLRFDGHPHEGSIVMALEVLENCSLENTILNQLVDNFKNPKDLATLSPEDFINRFGLSLKNYQNSDHGFWDLIRKPFKNIFKKSA